MNLKCKCDLIQKYKSFMVLVSVWFIIQITGTLIGVIYLIAKVPLFWLFYIAAGFVGLVVPYIIYSVADYFLKYMKADCYGISDED